MVEVKRGNNFRPLLPPKIKGAVQAKSSKQPQSTVTQLTTDKVYSKVRVPDFWCFHS